MCILLFLTSAALVAVTPDCKIRWRFMLLFVTTGLKFIFIVLYSYGTSVCLLILNVAIAIRLVFPSKSIRSTTGNNISARATKVGVTTLAVSVTFLVCSAPFTFVSIAWSAGGNKLTSDPLADEIIITGVKVLGLCNHTVNFYLYVLTSRSFRQTFVSMLRKPFRRCIQTPSTLEAPTIQCINPLICFVLVNAWG